MMVIIAERFHLFPFRTQKLSSHTSKIFGWRRPEKIDRCHQPDKDLNVQVFFLFGVFTNQYLYDIIQINQGENYGNIIRKRIE